MTTQPSTGGYTLDGAQSSVSFRHKTFWGLGTVRGTFSSVSGTGEVSADGSGSGTVVVGAATLDTKNPKRDTHLRSKDFFEAESFPDITFTATRITPTGEGAAQVDGELTVRGTSRKLAFPVRVETQDTVDVDRADFGMTWNQLGMIKGPATIELQLRFTAAR
jgi:polyisoprenoid-binding protein YceI